MSRHWQDQPRDKFGRWTDDGSDGLPSRSEITEMIIRQMDGKDPVLPKYKNRVVASSNSYSDTSYSMFGGADSLNDGVVSKAGSPKREVVPYDPSVEISSPLEGEVKIRGKDRYGEGHFGAKRKRTENDGTEVNYGHPGTDLVARPGTPVYATSDGVVRSFDPYGKVVYKRGRLNGVQINLDNGENEKLTYVKMRDDIKEITNKGEVVRVKKGDLIGHVEDLSPMYPGIDNHIHFQRETKDGKIRDVTPYLKKRK